MALACEIAKRTSCLTATLRHLADTDNKEPFEGPCLRDDRLIEAKRGENLAVKRSVSQRFTLLNLAANVLLAVGKGVLGILTGSLAILADALNSAGDAVYSIVLVIGMRWSLRPADRSHPEGHRRFEPLISLVIGVAVAIVAYQLVVDGIRGLMDPQPVGRNSWTVVVLVCAMVVKGYVSWLAHRNARQIHSPAVAAVGRDAAADVVATLAALAGYGGALLGWELADPVFSLVVSVFVARTAYQILHENMGYIVGRSASPQVIEKIRKIASAPDLVRGVHDLKVYFSGPALHVSLHLEIDRNQSLEAAHDAGQQVCLDLLNLPEIDAVSIHLDPVDARPERPGRSAAV